MTNRPPDFHPRDVARRIMELRLRHGITQTIISKESGVRESLLSAMLNGKRKGYRYRQGIIEVIERLEKEVAELPEEAMADERVAIAVESSSVSCGSTLLTTRAVFVSIGLVLAVSIGLVHFSARTARRLEATAMAEMQDTWRQRAVDIAMAAQGECQKYFLDILPRYQLERVKKADAGCVNIHNLVLGEAWGDGAPTADFGLAYPSLAAWSGPSRASGSSDKGEHK